MTLMTENTVNDALSRASFVIPSVNGARLLERMLPTLNIPAEIIHVLDQGSTDTTDKVCKQAGVNLRQLGARRTYTECCNIALQIAEDCNSQFVFISNNDIVFVTDVCRELLTEMLRDPSLGILSCSQLVFDENSKNQVLSNRVYWDLSTTLFEHETGALKNEFRRLEADFCELTCAILRVEAVKNVGGFDDGFGFYHEDADLGFRLRKAGYSAAYLPQSQIVHFAGSTFRQGLSDERRFYIERSKARFARKHLGYGVSYFDFQHPIPSSWTIINRNLFYCLNRLGLVDPLRPSLTFSHPGERPFDYLYTVWETSRTPDQWKQYRGSYKAVMVPSKWNQDVFLEDGFNNVRYVPLGVDTDIYHPWGARLRQYDDLTFLWFSRNQYRKGYDVLLNAWTLYRKENPSARLIVTGHDIFDELNLGPWKSRHWREYAVYEDLELNISYRQILSPLSDFQVAELYRSVDCVVVTSRSEGFGFNVVEALACGQMVVFPEFGATADMTFEGALTFDGSEVKADYSDKKFFDVGNWWEPCVPGIVNCLRRVALLTQSERETISRAGRQLVTSKFTWRNTAFAIRDVIATDQIQMDVSATRMKSYMADPKEWILDRLNRTALATEDLDAILNNSIDDIFKSFSEVDYLGANEDVRRELIDPLWHFILYGWLENRNVSTSVSARDYLEAHPSVVLFLVFHSGIGLKSPSQSLREMFFKWTTAKASQLSSTIETTDIVFIKLVYRMLLRRQPDAAGIQSNLKCLLDKSLSRQEVITQVAHSPEALATNLEV